MSSSDVLGAMIVGLGAAATLYAFGHLMRTMRWPWPGWAMPAGIALAMVGYGAWAEYAWADRFAAQLPDGAEVVAEGRDSRVWRPWTLVRAPVVRLAVLDGRAITREGATAQAPVLFVARDVAPREALLRADCSAGTGEMFVANQTRPDWAVVDPALVERLCR